MFNTVCQVSLERERQHDQTHVQNQLEKLDLLEQEYNKLTTMQALAEVSENFFLTMGGFFDEYMNSGTFFEREGNTIEAPEIDFSTLE